MSKNIHQSKKTKSSPKSTRGRKARTVSGFDPTGRNHSMVVNLQQKRATKKDVDYKKAQHLSPMVEPVAEDNHTTMVNIGMGRQDFAQMVRFITNKFHIIAEIFILILNAI